AVAAGEVAPHGVDAGARRVRSRMWVAVHTRAHPGYAVEQVDGVERRPCQRVVGDRGDGDGRRERVPAVLRDRDDLQARKLRGVCVLRPERLDGAVTGDGDLPGLTEALRRVVVARADLDRRSEGLAFVVGVRDVQLHVSVAGTDVAKHRPEEVQPTEVSGRVV